MTTKNGATTTMLDDVGTKFDEVKNKARDKADEYISKGMSGAESAGDAISDYSEKISKNVEGSIKKGLDRIRETSSQAQALAKKHPTATVLGAIGVSFLAGYFIAKSSNRS